jgi:hypothetical protein
VAVRLANAVSEGDSAPEDHLVEEFKGFDLPMDELPEDASEVGAKKAVRSGSTLAFVAAVAQTIKSELGTPTPTRANYLMVTRLVGKALAKLNVRSCDAAKHLPLIRAAVFAVTEFDVLEAKLYASRKWRRNVGRIRDIAKDEEPGWWAKVLSYATGRSSVDPTIRFVA